MKLIMLPAVALFCGAISANLNAAAINGTFSIAARITVTQNDIIWTLTDTNLTNKGSIVQTTGDFAGHGLEGTTVTLQDLNRTTEPVGVMFGPFPFLSFDAGGFPVLDISFINPGVFPSTDCFNPTPAAGQVCTLGPPDVPGGSPFNFLNQTGDSAHPIVSTASFSFTGTTSDGMSAWVGNFSSNFNEPFQNVIASFAGGANGSASNSYSAVFTLEAVAIPEPGEMALVGFGIIALSAMLRRKIRK